MEIFLIALLIFVILYLIFSITASFVFVEFAIRRKPLRTNRKFSSKDKTSTLYKRREDGKDWINSQKMSEGSITSFDGLKLVADIIEAKSKSDKTVIMMHGFRAQDYDDFACSVQCFYDEGYNIILPYQRAHGKSEGKYLYYGHRERFDCKDWIDFAIDRYGKNSKIVLMGVSMGCATVTMTLGFDLPENVKLCVADCGYTSAYDIFASVLKHDYHVPKFPIMNFSHFLAKKIAKFDMSEYSVKEALEKNKIPVLFIHGEIDTFVPTYMSKENYENCHSEKEILIIPNSKHATSFILETEKCWNAVKNMLDKFVK